jgi:hypothetical protein
MSAATAEVAPAAMASSATVSTTAVTAATAASGERDARETQQGHRNHRHTHPPSVPLHDSLHAEFDRSMASSHRMPVELYARQNSASEAYEELTRGAVGAVISIQDSTGRLLRMLIAGRSSSNGCHLSSAVQRQPILSGIVAANAILRPKMTWHAVCILMGHRVRVPRNRTGQIERGCNHDLQ